jgi:hypothetical protein
MSKRPRPFQLVVDEEDEELPSLSGTIWRRIAEHAATVRGLLQFTRASKLSDVVAGQALAAIFERDILRHASEDAPPNSIFRQLSGRTLPQPPKPTDEVLGTTEEAAWREYARDFLGPWYKAAVREVAEGMVAALCMMAARADDDARANSQSAQAQRLDADETAYEERYEASLALRPGGRVVGRFFIDRSWEGGLRFHFARELDSEAEVEEMALGRLEADLAEAPGARRLLDSGDRLKTALVDLFMMLLLGHSPRLTLALPSLKGHVSMATWGTLVENEGATQELDEMLVVEEEKEMEGIGQMSRPEDESLLINPVVFNARDLRTRDVTRPTDMRAIRSARLVAVRMGPGEAQAEAVIKLVDDDFKEAKYQHAVWSRHPTLAPRVLAYGRLPTPKLEPLIDIPQNLATRPDQAVMLMEFVPLSLVNNLDLVTPADVERLGRQLRLAQDALADAFGKIHDDPFPRNVLFHPGPGGDFVLADYGKTTRARPGFGQRGPPPLRVWTETFFKKLAEFIERWLRESSLTPPPPGSLLESLKARGLFRAAQIYADLAPFQNFL